MTEYLEIVENFLISHVADNFDFFTQSFDNIRDLEREMGEIKDSIKVIRDSNNLRKKQISSNLLGVYFLNRRMTIMKQIRKHLKLIKILRESIPVIRNLIKSGANFNTVTELMEKSFKLINERLLPINVALELRDKIHEAQGKSKKRIEEEFKSLLEQNFNSNIQFNSCLEDEIIQAQIRKFWEDDFRDHVIKAVNFKFIFDAWTFNFLLEKQSLFTKFKFLMANLIKMSLGDEIISQMKIAFNNNSKRYYHLMLDFLMSKVQSKVQSTTIQSKKEVFRHIDWESLLPSFMLLYLIFTGVYSFLDRLSAMFNEICNGSMNEETADKAAEVRSQKSAENNVNAIECISDTNKTEKHGSNLLLDKETFVQNRKKIVYLNQLKDEMNGILKSTSSYFMNKFVKWLKQTEVNIGSININELYTLKKYFEDIWAIINSRFEINTNSIKLGFNSIVNEYLVSFSKKKKDAIETLLRTEQWKTVTISAYFQDIISVVNDMSVSDEDFINIDKNKSDSVSEFIFINDSKYTITNSTLEMVKSFYDYIKVLKYFEESAVQVSNGINNLLKTYNSISGQQILGSEAYKSGILEKGITAKHLALTMHNLEFIMAEVAYIQEQICIKASEDKQDAIRKEFDVVLADFDNHKGKILHKLSTMLIEVIKKWLQNKPPAIYTNGTKVESIAKYEPLSFITQITKSMNSLNKVIAGILSEESRKIVFTGVFPQFLDEIDKFIDTNFIENNNEAGLNIFKKDLNYLENEIKHLTQGISTGIGFINRLRDIQEAGIDDFQLEEEEDEEDDDAN